MMRFVYFLAVAVACLSVAQGVFADGVTLKNGDHLTGSISAMDAQTITLTTDAAGDVKIKWSTVKELTSDKPLYVATPEKKTINGTVSSDGTSFIVHTSAGDVTIPVAKLTIVRSEEQEQPYEKSLHPSLLADWAGGLNLGFALARGNSNTTNLNAAFTGDRKTLSDEIKMSLSSVYATSGGSTTGAPAGVTADEILAAAAYDKNFDGSLFAFVSGAFTHDGLEDLDLEAIYSGGLGWHAINTPATTLDFNFGINYTRETYSAGATATMPTGVSVQRNLPGVTVGEAFMHKLGASTVLTEKFIVYPSLDQLDQYSFSLDAGMVTKINKWLAWQTSLSDRYVSNPPIAGTVPNDVILSTGINISFKY
jgi:putative salt-induced outer membrane protein YdiY